MTVTRNSLLKMYGKRVQFSAGRNIAHISDTHNEIGTFPISDIIVTFGKEERPDIIVERVHRSHYTAWQWYRLRKDLTHQCSVVNANSEFDASCTYAREYIDLTYSRQEWWQWLNSCCAALS